jgi:helicase
MALKAVFVGINKHQNPTIPELSGARRDATALWSLFTDTIPELSARLLVDEQATFHDMSVAILGTLERAHPDDNAP